MEERITENMTLGKVKLYFPLLVYFVVFAAITKAVLLFSGCMLTYPGAYRDSNDKNSGFNSSLLGLDFSKLKKIPFQVIVFDSPGLRIEKICTFFFTFSPKDLFPRIFFSSNYSRYTPAK